MKNLFLIIITFLCLFFDSCTVEEESPYTEFKDYSTFTANKVAWTEPDSYSFTYTYGTPPYQFPIVVTVKNGKPIFSVKTFSSEDEARPLDEEQASKYRLFNSISEIYDFFDKHWKETSAEENKNMQISFSAKYAKTDTGLVYPTAFWEHITDLENHGEGYVCDIYTKSIIINDFKLN